VEQAHEGAAAGAVGIDPDDVNAAVTKSGLFGITEASHSACGILV
jgi:hypothetical protein